MFSKDCMFNRTCKNKDTESCNKYCFPYVLLHGQRGNSGFYGLTGVPNKYKNCLAGNLPTKADNEKAYKITLNYIKDIIKIVEDKGVGLFIYSVPNKENRFGTGTGKTTTAITILNEYVISATRQHLQGLKDIRYNPAIFIKGSELQNRYNAQFRGGIEKQQQASEQFYSFKERMKKVSLLVVDDIAIRGITEAFENELYEVIDHRATEGLATIYTSNEPMSRVAEIMGDRIASRIEGTTVSLPMVGKDHRKGGLF